MGEINLMDAVELAGRGVIIVSAGVIGLAVGRMSTALRRWVQHHTVHREATAAAGHVLVHLANGDLALGDLTPAHPTIVRLAAHALMRVPAIAAALGGITPQTMAELVIGAVGHAVCGAGMAAVANDPRPLLHRPAMPKMTVVPIKGQVT